MPQRSAVGLADSGWGKTEDFGDLVEGHLLLPTERENETGTLWQDRNGTPEPVSQVRLLDRGIGRFRGSAERGKFTVLEHFVPLLFTTNATDEVLDTMTQGSKEIAFDGVPNCPEGTKFPQMGQSIRGGFLSSGDRVEIEVGDADERFMVAAKEGSEHLHVASADAGNDFCVRDADQAIDFRWSQGGIRRRSRRVRVVRTHE